MKKISVFCALVGLLCLTASVFAADPVYKKTVITEKFHGEGSAVGDFNKDGINDVVVGHFWYEGPDYKKSHQIYEGKDFNPEGYSNCFVMFTDDINKDGWTDIIVCPHPGTTGYWYENPKNQGKENEFWKKHETTIELGNESQIYVDINNDGQKELVFNRNNYYGFIEPNSAKPYEPWKFIAVSPEDKKYQRYFHGVGAGDINGDGRVDLIEKDGWFEQPKDYTKTPWTFHPFLFSDAASNILVFDADGDGLNDIVTARHCHLYGLVWFKQIRTADGKIDFQKNVIIPDEPADNFFPKVSQLHAMVAVDMNGDGRMDFVTGKRWWAHGSKKDAAPNDPALLLWFENKANADGSVTFVPHLIDDNTGVGTQVTVEDINGDKIPDVLVGNKKGARVFISQK